MTFAVRILSLLIFLGAGFFVAHRLQAYLQVDFMTKAQAQNPVPAATNVKAPSQPPPELPAPNQEATIEDSTTPVLTQDFIYDPTGKRDPFHPYVRVLEATTAIRDNNTYAFLNSTGPREALETFDLVNMQLVGVLWDVNDPKALIRIPSGKVYTVRKRSRIGRNNGYVAAIREGEIVVIEVSIDGKTPSTRILSLQK